MERLTYEKAVEDMTAYELAHNCMIVKDHEVWFRDFDREMPLRRLIRDIARSNDITLPTDDEEIDEYLYCCLQYDPIDETEGILALLNMLMWSHAENREALKKYEDADETGLIAACHCGECKHVDWRSMSTLRIRCAKTEMYKDADDFCKYAKRSDKEDAQMP